MLKRRIAAFSVATVAAIGALVAEAVLNDREAAIDRAGAEAANLAAGFEERIRSTLDAAPDLKRRIEAGALTFGLEERKSVARYLLNNQQRGFLGEAAAVDLIQSDGVRLARYTAAGGLDMATHWARKVPAAILGPAQAASTGAYSSHASTDGVARLYRWRKVLNYPLIVAVGLGRDEILTPANRQARIVVGLGIAALSLPLLMMVMLSREISSRVERAIALDQESEKVRQEHTALLSISEELAQERMKLRRTNVELIREKRRAEEANQAALELFRQVDNSLSRRFEGAGLGLPLAVKLTELHGGRLEVRSAPRRGTTVSVYLPASRVIWDSAIMAKPQLEDIPFKFAS